MRFAAREIADVAILIAFQTDAREQRGKPFCVQRLTPLTRTERNVAGNSKLSVAKMAPRVTLEFLPAGTLDVFDMLDRGQLDLAIGPFGSEGERFARWPLSQDGFIAFEAKSSRGGDAQAHD